MNFVSSSWSKLEKIIMKIAVLWFLIPVANEKERECWVFCSRCPETTFRGSRLHFFLWTTLQSTLSLEFKLSTNFHFQSSSNFTSFHRRHEAELYVVWWTMYCINCIAEFEMHHLKSVKINWKCSKFLFEEKLNWNAIEVSPELFAAPSGTNPVKFHRI